MTKRNPEWLKGNLELLTIFYLNQKVVFMACLWELISSGGFILVSMACLWELISSSGFILVFMMSIYQSS